MVGIKVPPHYRFLTNSLVEKTLPIKRKFYFIPQEENIQCIGDFEEIMYYTNSYLKRFSHLTPLITERINKVNDYLQNRSSTREDADKLTDWLLYPLQEMVNIYWDVKHMEFPPPYGKLYLPFLKILEKPIRDVFRFLGEFIDTVKFPERKVKDSPVITLTFTSEIDKEAENFSRVLSKYNTLREESKVYQENPVRSGFSIWNILGFWFLSKFFRRD